MEGGIAGSANFAFCQGLRQRIGHRIETSEIESQVFLFPDSFRNNL